MVFPWFSYGCPIKHGGETRIQKTNTSADPMLTERHREVWEWSDDRSDQKAAVDGLGWEMSWDKTAELAGEILEEWLYVQPEFLGHNRGWFP